MGIPFVYNPGDEFLSGEALQFPPPFFQARSAVIHDGLARSLVTRLKYGDRTDLAPFMAGWMVIAGRTLIDDCDMIVPIPLHLKRFVQRTYNQAAELARNIAKTQNKIFAPECLKRSRNTHQQVGMHRREREKNLKGAFIVPQHFQNKIKNKTILLIDDVYTTGATVKSATNACLKAGALRVNVLTFSRVVTYKIETSFA